MYRILEPDSSLSPLERVGEIAMGTLILVNVIVAIADSVDGFGSQYQTAFA